MSVCHSESRMKICFDDPWRVVRFDRTPWFRYMTGHGLRGVDFLAIREGTVYFIELKNYAPYRPGVASVLPDPSTLIAGMELKMQDTMRMTGIVYRTLERHWMFRVFCQWSRRIPILRRWEKEWSFWMDVREAVAGHRTQSWLVLAGYPSWPEHPPLAFGVTRPVPGLNTVMPGLHVVA